MKTKELLGKRISKIRMDVKDYEYEGSILLEISESNIELESGEVFEIPYRNSDDIDVDRRITMTWFSFYGHKILLNLCQDEKRHTPDWETRTS